MGHPRFNCQRITNPLERGFPVGRLYRLRLLHIRDRWFRRSLIRWSADSPERLGLL